MLFFQVLAVSFMFAAAERASEIEWDPEDAARKPVSIGALNLSFFPERCNPVLVRKGCMALNGGNMATLTDTEMVRRALSASKLANREFWVVFFNYASNVSLQNIVPKLNGHALNCTELCKLTVRYALHLGVVLAPKSDVGCRLSAQGSMVICDENAKPEEVSMFVRRSTGEVSHNVRLSSYHPFVNGSFQGRPVNAHQHTEQMYDDYFQMDVPDADLGEVSDFEDVDYSVWRYAVRLLGIFRIYGALPSDDIDGDFSLPMTESGEGQSLAEDGETEAARVGASTSNWYDDAERISARAHMYINVVMNEFLRNNVYHEFRTWFGKHSGSSLDAAKTRVREVLNSLINRFNGGLDFQYDRKCGASTYAWVSLKGECGGRSRTHCTYYVNNQGDRKYLVYLCGHYMTASTQEQIETIIHEVSHHQEAHTDDVCLDPPHNDWRRNCQTKAYDRPWCSKLAQRDGRLALQNADNYCYFAFDVGSRALLMQECEVRNGKASGPAASDDPDLDGDCRCKGNAVCYQNNQNNCQCSKGDDCEQHYISICKNCRCIKTTTTTTRQEVLERPSFRECFGFDEGGVKDQFPDYNGDCRCKDGYHCVQNNMYSEDSGVEGCPYFGSGYHKVKFSASCFVCECQKERKEEQIQEQKHRCGDKHKDHLETEDADEEKDCHCDEENGYQCYKMRRGRQSRGCPIADPTKASNWPSQGLDQYWFNIGCTDCICRKPRKVKNPLPELPQLLADGCPGLTTKVGRDCICQAGTFCSKSKDANILRRLDMCKVSDGTTSLTAFKFQDSGLVRCHNFKSTCDYENVAEIQPDTQHNCECAWGHACNDQLQGEPGCISMNMMHDIKHFVPIGRAKCERPNPSSSLKVCPYQDGHVVKNEFADDSGDCECTRSKCWQRLQNGIRPGCENSRPKLSKLYFAHDCQGCECRSQPPTCPSNAYKKKHQIPTPDDDGDCMCPPGQLCRQKVSGDRCKASDGTSDQHEYFSLTCQNCECYEVTCQDGLSPETGGDCTCPPERMCYTVDETEKTVELGCDRLSKNDDTKYYAVCDNCECMTDKQYRIRLARLKPKPKPPNPCGNFESEEDYKSCSDVVRGSEKRENGLANMLWRSATCKCSSGFHITGEKVACRRGDRRHFNPRDLFDKNCCCFRDK